MGNIIRKRRERRNFSVQTTEEVKEIIEETPQPIIEEIEEEKKFPEAKPIVMDAELVEETEDKEIILVDSEVMVEVPTKSKAGRPRKLIIK
jgi:hypothetical protein